MNILAIGSHPDDIEFGCGGTLLKHVKAGHDVYMMVLTRGGVGGEPEIRIKEQEEAAQFLGVKKVYWGEYRDTEIPLNKEFINQIEDVIKEVKPQLVLFTHKEDTHQDHRNTTRACLSATRYVKEVMCFEVPSSQDFLPDIYVDIGDVVEEKMYLLQKHASQVNRTNVENLTILESARSCAIFRGYQGRVKFAEGFKAIRILKSIENETVN